MPYNKKMDYDEIKTNVSANLTELRKSSGLTQVEFGEKFAFSDKTISKWESGASIPDVATLCQIANEFNISLDDLVKSHNISEDHDKKTNRFKYSLTRLQHIAVLFFVVVFIWACALMIFIFVKDFFKVSVWPIFLWAIPISAVCIHYYTSRFIGNNFILKLSLDTITAWSTLMAIYYSFLVYNITFRSIFFLGIPLQIIVVLVSYIKTWRRSK